MKPITEKAGSRLQKGEILKELKNERVNISV